MPDRIKELLAAIEAVDREIESVSQPLEARRLELSAELRALQLEAFAAEHGLREGDEIAFTGDLWQVLVGRNWNVMDRSRFSKAQGLRIKDIDVDRNTISIETIGDNAGAGGFSVELVKKLRQAWLDKQQT